MTTHRPSEPDPTAMDPGYFTDAPNTVRIAIAAARILLAAPYGEMDAATRWLHEQIADGQLIVHAHTRDAADQRHALAVHRPTGQHLLLSGTGTHLAITASFSTGVQARQYFRAHILRQPPSVTKNHRADLQQFATRLAAHLPGWSAGMRDITLGAHQAELAEQVWDLGSLHGAFQQYALHEAAALTGPDAAQAVVVHRPGCRDQFLVGALRPAALPIELLDAHDAPVPMAIAVGRDPLRAAAEVRQRLLPRYEHAVLALRIQVLREAAEGIEKALADWDAVSDSLCDQDGYVLDNAAYEEGLVTRDAAAWGHVETFLAHAPHVLKAAREHLQTAPSRDDEPHRRLAYSIRASHEALAEAGALQAEWETVQANHAGHPDGAAPVVIEQAREDWNSEGWHYATELAAHAPTVLAAAGPLPPPASAQVSAALARSAPNASPATGAPPTPAASPPTRAPHHAR